MSSRYLTWPPYFWSNDSRTDLSMEDGQFEKVQSPIGTFLWLTFVAFCCLPWLSPFTPPHAARKDAVPLKARPVPASRRTNSRRECSSPSSMRATTSSRWRSWSGIGLLGNDESVLGGPGEEHVLTWAEGGVRAAVLLDDGELLAAAGLHEVLDGGPEERGKRELTPQDVGTRRGRPGGREPQGDLLGTDAALDGRAVGVGRRSREAKLRAVVGLEGVRAVAGAVDQ